MFADTEIAFGYSPKLMRIRYCRIIVHLSNSKYHIHTYVFMKMIYCRLIIVNDFGWNSCLIWRLVKLQLNVKHHNQCSLILMPTRRECIYTSMNVSFLKKVHIKIISQDIYQSKQMVGTRHCFI